MESLQVHPWDALQNYLFRGIASVPFSPVVPSDSQKDPRGTLTVCSLFI